MSPSVAVVTDSTAYLGVDETARWGIAVVPVHVVVGDREFDEGGPLDGEALARALRDQSPVTTSRPAPERFSDVYKEAAAQGAAGVVSVHLSGAMSGTVESARLAAREAPVPVEVVDSRSIAMGLGFAVLAAARVANAGGWVDETAAAARRRAEESRTFFYVDTLDHLRRGGRIGMVTNLVGSALSIKPLLHLGDGAITLLERVRTASRAIARLEDLVVAAAGERQVEVAVQHLMAATRADALAASLSARLPGLTGLRVVEVGPVLGAHAGPGMLGVTIVPAE
ncbi:DegV family protein [Microbispora sp. ATCC PTA-5024]|uniref:DegV family protein n=1 Tax=Microbispora sp. ATCC PTA-5024 TaxID=316330 RepID=UPI00055F3B0E|nr:DegV family protein [Microbispora sp. ATCC PTA-5024]